MSTVETEYERYLKSSNQKVNKAKDVQFLTNFYNRVFKASLTDIHGNNIVAGRNIKLGKKPSTGQSTGDFRKDREYTRKFLKYLNNTKISNNVNRRMSDDDISIISRANPRKIKNGLRLYIKEDGDPIDFDFPSLPDDFGIAEQASSSNDAVINEMNAKLEDEIDEAAADIESEAVDEEEERLEEATETPTEETESTTTEMSSVPPSTIGDFSDTESFTTALDSLDDDMASKHGTKNNEAELLNLEFNKILKILKFANPQIEIEDQQNAMKAQALLDDLSITPQQKLFKAMFPHNKF